MLRMLSSRLPPGPRENSFSPAPVAQIIIRPSRPLEIKILLGVVES